MKTLIVITGATASGKTSVALDVAEALGCDIISADSRQIYSGLPIGTAAPTADEQARVRHHLVGTLPLDAYYSASQFEHDALRLMEQQWQQGDYALVCGGSMMYIDALCNGIDEMPTISDATRNYCLSLLNEHGLEGVLAQLQIVDPEYYDIVDRQNTRRIVHALEVSLEAACPYSKLRTGKIADRPFEIIKFAIDRPRQELFERINKRVGVMIESGLEAEARRAFAKGRYNSLNTVGYKEMLAYFEGEMDYDTAVARIAKNTRVYAKKQLTWMARDNSIIKLEPSTAFDSALTIINERLSAQM